MTVHIGGAEFTLGESTCLICKDKPKFKSHKEFIEHMAEHHDLKQRFGRIKNEN